MKRASLRARWVRAVAAAPVGNATKALLLYFAATCMTAGGYIDPPTRDHLADVFGVHPQRIAERLLEAKRARLIAQLNGSGVRGRPARYVATMPPATVPESGTDKATNRAGFVTGERYPQIGTLASPLGTAERYAQRARAYRTVTRQRHDGARNVCVSPEHVRTEERSDEKVGRDSALAAVLRKFDGRRPSCVGLRVREAVAA